MVKLTLSGNLHFLSLCVNYSHFGKFVERRIPHGYRRCLSSKDCFKINRQLSCVSLVSVVVIMKVQIVKTLSTTISTRYPRDISISYHLFCTVLTNIQKAFLKYMCSINLNFEYDLKNLFISKTFRRFPDINKFST